MKEVIVLVITLLFSNSIFAQSLFESSNVNQNSKKYDLKGEICAFGFFGEDMNSSKITSRSLYTRSKLKINAKKENWGKAYSEIEFRNGLEFTQKFNELSIKEAYVKFQKPKLNISLGKQIISWGKADGINPTNNITPKNYFYLSPNNDDINIGNYLANLNWSPIKEIAFQVIWIPIYETSIYKYDLFDFPEMISFSESKIPNSKIGNSAYALKFDLRKSKFESSLSYFNGYHIMPGLNYLVNTIDPLLGIDIAIFQHAFHKQSIGFDFSTSIGKLAFRGESAYNLSTKNPKETVYVPNTDIDYIFGFDLSIANFLIITQYIGKYVFDFKKFNEPIEFDPENMNPSFFLNIDQILYDQIDLYNAIIFNQKNELSHSISSLLKYSNTYVNTDIELFNLYNISTEEYFVRLLFGYSFTDSFNCSIGAQYYYGEDYTQFNWLSPVFNGVFFETKISF